jgi:hypothetical protein
MSEDICSLNLFIKNSFKETIEYLKKNDIQIEGRLSLIIVGSLEEFQQMYKTNEKFKFARYVSEKREIQIIKNGLKRIINNDINDQNKIFIGNLFTITHNGILWPVHKNDDDIEKIITKAVIDSIVTHEIGHHIVGYDDWRASAFEFLVYFYKNELYRYPEVYEIIKKNIKICDEYIRKKYPSSSYSLGSPLSPYGLGSCFANNLIYIHENLLNKDKQSTTFDIKNIIEKLRYFSEEEGINATIMINTLLITKDYYIDINKMFNTLTKVLMLLHP